MKRVRGLAIANFLSLLLHLIVVYASNTRQFARKNVKEIADQYASLFTPADLSFLIWGVIYTALIAFCLYHIIMSFRKSPSHSANIETDRMGWWFIVYNVVSSAWLFFWVTNHMGISMSLIITQFILLGMIAFRLRVHNPYSSFEAKTFTHFPLSICFGWVTVAMVANIAIYLHSINWNGMGWGYTPITWAQFFIGFLIMVTIIVVLAQRNVFYGLAVIWGLYGIMLKRRAIDPEEYGAIIQTAWVGMILLGVICLIQFFNNLGAKKKQFHMYLSPRKKSWDRKHTPKLQR
jgi:hypothetical protein